MFIAHKYFLIDVSVVKVSLMIGQLRYHASPLLKLIHNKLDIHYIQGKPKKFAPFSKFTSSDQYS